MTLVLTDDERTVLMIAAEGQSMMPIGRWEAPVEHLVEIGFLERHDKWNNLITTAGKQALEQVNDDIDTVAAKALITRHNAGVVYRERGEALAKQLVEMVRAAAVTGDSSRTALNKCLQAIKDRALNLLGTPASDQKAIDVEPD